MVIRKCEHTGCEKIGACRCPKDRELKDYWHFCQIHAAEYNKNWNYYAGLSPDEINKIWEKDVFGETPKNGSEYSKLIDDFLHGKTKIPEKRKTLPKNAVSAFEIFGLSCDAKWADVQKKYRSLAKQEHPDTSKSKDQSRFVKISAAYQTLKLYFK